MEKEILEGLLQITTWDLEVVGQEVPAALGETKARGPTGETTSRADAGPRTLTVARTSMAEEEGERRTGGRGQARASKEEDTEEAVEEEEVEEGTGALRKGSLVMEEISEGTGTIGMIMIIMEVQERNTTPDTETDFLRDMATATTLMTCTEVAVLGVLGGEVTTTMITGARRRTLTVPTTWAEEGEVDGTMADGVEAVVEVHPEEVEEEVLRGTETTNRCMTVRLRPAGSVHHHCKAWTWHPCPLANAPGTKDPAPEETLGTESPLEQGLTEEVEVVHHREMMGATAGPRDVEDGEAGGAREDPEEDLEEDLEAALQEEGGGGNDEERLSALYLLLVLHLLSSTPSLDLEHQTTGFVSDA